MLKQDCSRDFPWELRHTQEKEIALTAKFKVYFANIQMERFKKKKLSG